jgi:predicted metal-dependent hydrolase
MADKENPNPQPGDCQGRLHPMAELGIALFNAGEYWKAHEALEAAWRAERGEARHLYRGLLQVGVGYLHVQRRNYAGAMKLYHRSQHWLGPFPDHCRGIDVRQLKADFDKVIAEVRRLGPDHLDAFDFSLLKPVKRDEGKN